MSEEQSHERRLIAEPAANHGLSAAHDIPTETVEIPETALQAIMRIAASEFHQRLLPDIESFERYEKTLPGSGDRIIKMAEKEQELRLAQTPVEQKREFIGRMTGQAIGFASLITIIGCGSYVAIHATSAGQIAFACALIAPTVFLAVEKATDFFRKN